MEAIKFPFTHAWLVSFFTYFNYVYAVNRTLIASDFNLVKNNMFSSGKNTSILITSNVLKTNFTLLKL